MTSIEVAWVKLSTASLLVDKRYNKQHFISNQLTKIKTPIKINITWLWKLIIPSITGVAGTWNVNCQETAASEKEFLLSKIELPVINEKPKKYL